MKSKASAPGKVILFGEHFVVYGIKSMLCSINKRVTVTAERTKERKISINSAIGKLVLEPKEYSQTLETYNFEKPEPKEKVTLISSDEIEKLIDLLHNEAKAI